MDDEIDYKKIYMTNFKPHKPRVGKEYQAVIPDVIPKTEKKTQQESNIKNLKELNEQKKAYDKIEKNDSFDFNELNKPIKKRKLKEEK